jgi:sulfate/thiosulfate transport system substrate-binding protein
VSGGGRRKIGRRGGVFLATFEALFFAAFVATFFAATALSARPALARTVSLLNASYDVTRELYRDIDAAFAKDWKRRSGDDVVVNQSHGGSSKQARAVIDGLGADVVTMNQALDIDMISRAGALLPSDWAGRLPNHSVPFTSTILFLVRHGNPKKVRGWEDLVRPGVTPIIPSPKTSGNGRYTYLAAWGYALRKWKGDEAAARAFVGKLFKGVPVMDTGGRGASTTFVQRQIGDVLLTFENEARLAMTESGAGSFEIVVPSLSILAENPVAVVDKVAAKHGTTDLATAYLQFLFTDEAQDIAARHDFRPVRAAAVARAGNRFPQLELLSIEDLGGWTAIQKRHFADGGLFDQIYAAP